MKEYNDQINELINDFSFFENWEDKYQYLIDLGRNVPAMSEELKIDENKLKGCQSVVYFSNSFNSDGSITYMATSDAAIVQGLIALMLKVFSGKKPQEILDINVQQAMYNFYEQMIVGDTADNVNYFKGKGKKFAEKYFENCVTEYQYTRKIYSAQVMACLLTLQRRRLL